jgi:alkylation response protein AidB-like acyl-CoA dehydrogenase
MMMFALSERAQDFIARTQAFIQQEIEPIEKAFWDEVHHLNVDGDWTKWQWPEQLQQLKDKAKAAGLWNMFLLMRIGCWFIGSGICILLN